MYLHSTESRLTRRGGRAADIEELQTAIPHTGNQVAIRYRHTLSIAIDIHASCVSRRKRLGDIQYRDTPIACC